MEQDSINQRLNFLVESLAESARAFSDLIGESPTNTHNYISAGKKPNPKYLKSLLLHYRNINAHWLITGEGEPFLVDRESGATQVGNFNQAGNANSQKVKGNKNNVQTANGDHSTITNNVELEGCRRDLTVANKEIEMLRSQLADKERIIQLLEKK